VSWCASHSWNVESATSILGGCLMPQASRNRPLSRRSSSTPYASTQLLSRDERELAVRVDPVDVVR